MFCKTISLRYNSAYPYSLSNKLKSYYSIVKNDRQYRKGILCMTANEFGDGIAAGAGFAFANYIGTFNHEMSTGLVAVVRVVEATTMIVSYLIAAHKRDNAEFFSKDMYCKKEYDHNTKTYLKQLDKSALYDLAITATVIAGIALSMFEEMLTFAVGIFTITRIPRIFNKGYESGAYNSMKYTLGNESTHKYQQKMTHSIGAIEGGMTSVSFLAAFSAAYTSCVSLAGSGCDLLVLTGAFTISAVVQFLPKLIFSYQIKNNLEEEKNND